MKADKKRRVYPHSRKMLLLAGRLWESGIQMVFPQSCMLCHKRESLLCISCLSKHVDYQDEDGIVSLFHYKDPPIRDGIIALKFHNNQKIGISSFGVFLHEAILDTIAGENIYSIGSAAEDPIMLIPIPLSRKRKKKRGYNQSEVLVKGILKQSPDNSFILDSDVLKKKRDTIPQTQTKDRTERSSNLHDVFEVSHPERVENKTILLIDDVTTTGTTFREARKTLREAGAKKVWCIALAH